MRKCLLLLIAIGLMGAYTAMYAQGTFSLGPRGGVNFANVSDVDESETLIGLVAGITSTYSINETSGITLDILYSAEGYKYNDSEFNANYIQIPLYYNMFFGELGQAFRPKVYVGVAGGILLDAEADGVDVKDQMNDFIFSLTGGLGFNYRMAERIWLNVDLRAFIGMTQLAEDAQFVSDAAARNVQASVGVAYGLSQ